MTKNKIFLCLHLNRVFWAGGVIFSTLIPKNLLTAHLDQNWASYGDFKIFNFFTFFSFKIR